MGIRILSILLLISSLASCTKESEIRQKFNPAAETAIAFHQAITVSNLCFAELIQDYDLSRYGLPFLAFTNDSGLRLNHGRNSLRKDQVRRKGICYIRQFVNSGHDADSTVFNASTADSFAVQTSSGWQQITGRAVLARVSATQFRFTFNLMVDDQFIKGEVILEADMLPGNQISSYSAKSWTGIIESVAGRFELSKCMTSSQAPYQIIFKGKAVRQSDNLEIDYNPFSDGALDFVVKVRQGRDEMLFDSW